MVTRTRSVDHEIEATAAVRAAEELLSDTRPDLSSVEPKDNLAVKFAKALLTFYDWLSGPATTNRDRLRREIAETGPMSSHYFYLN